MKLLGLCLDAVLHWSEFGQAAQLVYREGFAIWRARVSNPLQRGLVSVIQWLLGVVALGLVIILWLGCLCFVGGCPFWLIALYLRGC